MLVGSALPNVSFPELIQGPVLALVGQSRRTQFSSRLSMRGALRTEIAWPSAVEQAFQHSEPSEIRAFAADQGCQAFE